MTIHFTDPGLNPTFFIVTGIISAVPIFFGLIFLVLHFMRTSKKSIALDISAALFVVGGVLTLFVFGGVGGVGTSRVYQDDVRAALYEELTNSGFDQIIIEDVSNSPDTLRGTLNGREFVGTIENLNYPKDFTYKVTETIK